ncbi:hypothetical protein [Streptomyces pseudovenezuelae]|uniref:hypothetical protein n=1 Tax=Streptomyces pseudovenezuelae TaxID=67350 RepID=UPI002E333E33|nr:hypothetical protein [Streptomyces pseudovenezuelae]
MAGKKRAAEPVEEPEGEPSRAAGACVLVVLAGVVVAAAFAIDEAAGVLLVVVSGAVAVWRSARRKGTDLALPSPTERGPDSDERARRRAAKAKVALDPNGVMCIMQPPREEAPEPAPPDEETERRRIQAVLDRLFPRTREEVSDR